jgi:hypothetical protein
MAKMVGFASLSTTLRSDLSLGLILRSIAISAHARVFDALWRCVSKEEAAHPNSGIPEFGIMNGASRQ